MKSLSAIERANPPPRRKSCLACIKAKRRCDLGQPACLRCTQRLLECRYDLRGSTVRDHLGPRPMTQHADMTAGSTSTSSFALTITGDYGISATSGSTESNSADLPALSEPTLDVEFDFLNPDLDMDMLQFTQDAPAETDLDELLTIARPPTPSYNKLDLVLPPKDTSLACQSGVEWNLRTTPLSVTIAHRLQYAINLVKDAPRRMVVDLETPWCHAQLYRDEMPRSMQGAQTCSRVRRSSLAQSPALTPSQTPSHPAVSTKSETRATPRSSSTPSAPACKF